MPEVQVFKKRKTELDVLARQIPDEFYLYPEGHAVGWYEGQDGARWGDLVPDLLELFEHSAAHIEYLGQKKVQELICTTCESVMSENDCGPEMHTTGCARSKS